MRLHAENPELSHEELTDLAMRTGSRLPEGEPRYDYTCPKCGDEYSVGQKMNDWIQSLDRLPKCGDCYL
jgi:predicted RNA-binding Zn-ribbon protein involved in translation (DUF1610 family)